MAYADALALTCKRSDVVNALDYFYLIDTAASKVGDASGPVEKRHTYFARITNTAIDWTNIGGATYHIDRLSGHMTMVNRAGTFEFNCRKAQGF